MGIDVTLQIKKKNKLSEEELWSLIQFITVLVLYKYQSILLSMMVCATKLTLCKDTMELGMRGATGLQTGFELPIFRAAIQWLRYNMDKECPNCKKVMSQYMWGGSSAGLVCLGCRYKIETRDNGSNWEEIKSK